MKEKFIIICLAILATLLVTLYLNTITISISIIIFISLSIYDIYKHATVYKILFYIVTFILFFIYIYFLDSFV